MTWATQPLHNRNRQWPQRDSANDDGRQPAAAQRDARGNVDLDSVPDVIQWFLDFDQRVAIIKHPNVEEVFQWKQEQSREAGEEVFAFNRLRTVWPSA